MGSLSILLGLLGALRGLSDDMGVLGGGPDGVGS